MCWMTIIIMSASCLRETLGHQRSRGKRSDESESQSTTEKAQAIETYMYDGKHDTKNKATCIKVKLSIE